MSKRKAISKTRRFEIFKRDAFTCQYCGSHPPAAVLHVDHIVAVAKGGGNEDENLVTSCLTCNLGKGVRDLRLAPESLADKAARVAEAEEQLAGYAIVMDARRERLESQAWQVFFCLTGKWETTKDRFQSTRMFVEKLGFHEALAAAEIAAARGPFGEDKCFRYFCGVCWNKLRESGQ